MVLNAAAVRAGGNLPAEVTSFVGRRRELAEVKRALTNSRLVTLTGAGGVGKTRVAQRLARDRRRAYPHGVWLIELAELPDPALLTKTVLTELGTYRQLIPCTGDVLEELIDALSDRHLLLVLDNCEHLLDEVSALATVLLRRCPDLQILATSRAPIGVVGEMVIPVPAMAVPEPDRSGGMAGLSRYDAVALFTDRAMAAVPDFALTQDNYRAVAALCHRLDGLPLAIELAAGRLRSLSPQQILSKLDDRYALLKGGERGRPDRQQTLRASVEWSYQLCTQAEQRLWAELCVFSGGFDLDAVETVCPTAIGNDDVVDLMAGLVDKSIVVRYQRGDSSRYRLLDALREFGWERLSEAGDAPTLKVRHLQWYTALVHIAQSEWISARQVYWLTRLAAESVNGRSALEFCLHERGDVDAVMDVMLAVPLGSFGARGNLSEGRYWLDEALARPGPVTVLRVRALLRSSLLAIVGGDAVAGVRMLDAASNLIPQIDNPIVFAEWHFVASHAARCAGDLPRAIGELEQALALAKTNKADLDEYLDILQSLALVTTLEAQDERSRACSEEILALTEPRGECLHRAQALTALGLDAWRRGEAHRAAALFRAGLAIELGFDEVLGTALRLETLAWATGTLGQHRRAAQLIGAADMLWDAAGGSFATTLPDLLDEHEKAVAATRAALGDQLYTAAFRRGRQTPLAQVLEDAVGRSRATRTRRVEAGRAGVLTPREEEVVALLARGLSNKDIANHLIISQRTAETHVENVLIKLGLTSRSQVAAWVADHRGGEPAE